MRRRVEHRAILFLEGLNEVLQLGQLRVERKVLQRVMSKLRSLRAEQADDLTSRPYAQSKSLLNDQLLLASETAVVVLQTNVIAMTVDPIEIRTELASRIYLSVLYCPCSCRHRSGSSHWMNPFLNSHF